MHRRDLYFLSKYRLKAKKEIVKRWLDKCPSLFGIVKTDKQTSFFDGRIVQTNYQLLNTLPLTKVDIESFLSESRKYYDDIQLHPEVMAFYLNYNYYKDVEEIDEKDDEESEENTFNFDNLPHVYQDKFKIVSKLLGLNEDFPKTNLYRDFRSNVRSTLYDKLKKGKVLVRGTNATIFSNGYEMLLYIINKLNDKYKPILKDNEVFSYFFNEGEELCLGRSPHITMGNVYYAKNVKEPEPIKKYFVLSKEIIYFNSINNNVMNRLNDCDFDSDSLLITNDSHLVNAAKKVYQNFKVPVNGLPSSAKDLDLYKIDYNISSNKIGQIVNFSQLLNSIYWDSSTRENVNINREELYKDICILSILSGVEIDKAKRDYDVNVPEVIKKLKEKYLKGFYETNRPFFFNHRILDILSSSTKKIENVPFSTTMDYICDAAKNKAFVQRKREGTVSFQDLVNHSSNTNLSSYNRKKVKESRDIIEKYYIEYNKICAKYKGDDTFNQRKDDWLCRLLKDFEDYLTNNDCIYKLLSSIDTKDMIKYFWIILYFIFNRDKNNANFYKQVFKEKTDNLYKLVIDDDAINPDFEYYGIKLVKEKV